MYYETNHLDKLIDKVNGSIAMKGMPLMQSDKDRIRCAGNDKLAEKTIAELVKKHTVAHGHDHEEVVGSSPIISTRILG
ncbi:hypothetical protein REC12_03160 [Desulfosporosinus sp. PR]|nr:hypothetical protein [Desulfosporosinus sp. PR]